MSGSTTEDIPRLLALARVGDRTAVGRLLGEYRGYLSILARLHDDGQINGLDVDPFLAAVLSGKPNGLADMNQDGVVNGLDVDPFVSAVVAATALRLRGTNRIFRGPPNRRSEVTKAQLLGWPPADHSSDLALTFGDAAVFVTSPGAVNGGQTA